MRTWVEPAPTVDRTDCAPQSVGKERTIDDLHFLCTCVGPAEADPPLLVDSDAVLAFPVSFQLLHTVAGWDLEVGQVVGGVEKQELPMIPVSLRQDSGADQGGFMEKTNIGERNAPRLGRCDVSSNLSGSTTVPLGG
jgi:hypothetical protein